MSKVIIGIGIPGSGKTTALKAFAEKNGYSYVCPDDIRKEMTGNPIDQSRNKEVWTETYQRVAKELEEGDTVVVDATFTNQDQRKNFVDFAKAHGAEKVQGIFMDTPLEIAKERNSLRGRQVPEYVLDRTAESIEKNPPGMDDGFDGIFTINEYQKLKEAEVLKEGEILRKKFGGIR